MRIRGNLAWIFAVLLSAATSAGSSAQTLPASADPLQAGEHMVEINGLKLWYEVSGTGPVCVWPSSAWGPASDLYFLTDQSMEKYFTVVYLDSRGTGRSGRTGKTTEYTWDHLVRDLESLRIHLNQQRICLMGHSEGGAQVMHYACAHPDRVNGLVLLATLAVADQEEVDDYRMRMKQLEGKPQFDEALKALKAGKKPDESAAEFIKATAAVFWCNPSKADAFHDAWDVTTISDEAMAGQRDSKRYPFDLREQLKAVKAPALIVAGADDAVCSLESARRTHLALGNSKLLVIEQCGHFPWMEQPAAFEAHVAEFLRHWVW